MDLAFPIPKGRGLLLPPTTQWLDSPFLVGRSASLGCVISPRRAGHIVLYAVYLLPTNLVELHMFIVPK